MTVRYMLGAARRGAQCVQTHASVRCVPAMRHPTTPDSAHAISTGPARHVTYGSVLAMPCAEIYSALAQVPTTASTVSPTHDQTTRGTAAAFRVGSETSAKYSSENATGSATSALAHQMSTVSNVQTMRIGVSRGHVAARRTGVGTVKSTSDSATQTAYNVQARLRTTAKSATQTRDAPTQLVNASVCLSGLALAVGSTSAHARTCVISVSLRLNASAVRPMQNYMRSIATELGSMREMTVGCLSEPVTRSVQAVRVLG
jgi:hypothetical protein